MRFYTITSGTEQERQVVMQQWPSIERLSEPIRDQVVTAWVSAWKSSPFRALVDMPYTIHAPSYQLAAHVNEVAEAGTMLAGFAQRWGWMVAEDDLLATLLLHDIDKPLLYVHRGGTVVLSPAAAELPHGVLGSLLLHDVGLPDVVVNTVATHASTSPFHGSTPLACILHYADFFSADHALMLSQQGEPFYQKHWR